MRSSLPKVLHPVAGKPMIAHVLETAASLNPRHTLVVVGPDMADIPEGSQANIVQEERLGTAHAVEQCRGALEGFTGDVLILYGDGPLITRETLEAMIARRSATEEQSDAPAFVWMGVRLDEPTGYGRLILSDDGTLERIVEEKDASDEERTVDFIWGGLLLADAQALFEQLAHVDNKNAKGEYYLTSLVALGKEANLSSVTVEGDEEEFRGVNSRAELAVAEAIMQTRLRAKAMAAGASFIDPTTVYLSADSEIGQDVTIHPNVVIGPGVSIADGAEIKSFSHLEHAKIGPGAVIGPYARLRPGAEIGKNARVGNFVEVKKTTLGEGAKVNHLTYLGDASIGAGANIGAGTITCNFDGFEKHKTEIGEGAFIGSNSALVAPVTVGKNAMIAAGSTVTKDVPEDALGIGRGAFKVITGWAARFRTGKSQVKKDS